MNDAEKTEKNNLYVGEGVRVVGEVFVPGQIQVFGIVEGKVTGKDIRVGASGRIEGSLEADFLDLEGSVSETVLAKDTLIIRSTARLAGIIEYQSIEIEAGAEIEGQLKRLGKVEKSTQNDMQAKKAPEQSAVKSESRLSPQKNADEEKVS
ncbi:MAG: polymer-forming cytoskeletal protein [Desulfuromonadales bacterium]|nr:polymer-forming cytoskeletal protein [Desulfuromonadales bacterium]